MVMENSTYEHALSSVIYDLPYKTGLIRLENHVRLLLGKYYMSLVFYLFRKDVIRRLG